MKKTQWIAVVVVTATMGLVGTARAAMYAYARQQTSAYSITGATAGAFTNNSSTSAFTDISNTSNNPFNGDAQQSFSGFGLPPAQNTFTQSSPVATDYARGDALVSPVFATDNVAESRLAGLVNSSAAGSWISTVPLTVSSAGAINLGFSYLNEIELFHDGFGGSSTQASFSWNFSLRNAGGAVVFNSSPAALNSSAGLVTGGTVDTPGSGAVVITTGTLAPGTYTMTLSGTETAFIYNNAGVPEPASMGVVGCAVIALARRRSRR